VVKREATDELLGELDGIPASKRGRFDSELAKQEMTIHICDDCGRKYRRQCDLTKHQKTHSRPFKCPIVKCRYNDYGWPTEKENERHFNDKHSDKPPMYRCKFTPCDYESKRESNCKQHMEKAHGWEYVRSKRGSKSKAGPDAKLSSSITEGKLLTPCMSTPREDEFWHVSGFETDQTSSHFLDMDCSQFNFDFNLAELSKGQNALLSNSNDEIKPHSPPQGLDTLERLVSRKLGCPFNKRFPQKYNGNVSSKYKSCRDGWKDVRHVK
jgi:hypothetical protein